MHSKRDLAYFAQRAAEERQLAATAPTRHIAALHEGLALAYEARLRGQPVERRTVLGD